MGREVGYSALLKVGRDNPQIVAYRIRVDSRHSLGNPGLRERGRQLTIDVKHRLGIWGGPPQETGSACHRDGYLERKMRFPNAALGVHHRQSLLRNDRTQKHTA